MSTRCTTKVYQGNIIDYGRSKEHQGQCSAVVAARSWAEAHRIVSAKYPNVSMHYMRNYWSITANEEQVAAARRRPYKLLLSSSLRRYDDYKEVL